MSKILNIGSLNIDKTYSVKDIVRQGETISSLDYQEFVGGKGLNQSVAVARANGEVCHVGLVGSDGDNLIKTLSDSNVITSLIKQIHGPSGHAIIQIDRNGDNCIIVEGGANHKLDRDYIDNALMNCNEGDVVLIQNEINNLEYIINMAFDRKLPVAFNPSPMTDELKALSLDKIAIFILNEIEGNALTNKKVPNEILDEMMRLYPESKVVLTLGDKGCMYKDKEQFIQVEANKVDVVDTTGAGDTFCGYFLASLINGRKVEDSLVIANRASSIACTIKGASNSIPLLEDVEK